MPILVGRGQLLKIQSDRVHLSSRTSVSEVLNRKHSLSLNMIRELYKGLEILANILVQP